MTHRFHACAVNDIKGKTYLLPYFVHYYNVAPEGETLCLFTYDVSKSNDNQETDVFIYK